MQPSEEFRPLPHIYLNAARRSAVLRSKRGAPFIVRQPICRSYHRTNERGVNIYEASGRPQYVHRSIQECSPCFVIEYIRKIFSGVRNWREFLKFFIASSARSNAMEMSTFLPDAPRVSFDSRF